MTLALVILLAVALAGLTYLWLERVGTKAWPAIACRAVAWAALGVLLVNLTCALPASALKPMVLFESDDLVALASEEVAIRAIVPREIDTSDPYDEEVRVWQR